MNHLSKGILFLSLAGGLTAGDMLPLATGNQWAYRDAATGQSFMMRVGTPVFINQTVYYSLHGYAEGMVLVRANEKGDLFFRDEDRDMDVLLTSFNPENWFDAPRRQCPEHGQALRMRGDHQGPAGRWSVVEVSYVPYSCGDAGDQTEQFAENIGMVRRVVNTIAGPRTFDLVFARVGNQTISASDTGSFSVMATPGTDPGTWLATMRIDLGGGSLKLRFPSAQEFDLKLRDQDGNILWTWSADKLFAQAAHQIVIAGSWTATVVVPHPPAIPEGPATYTLEAFLTTAETEPRMGGVTTVIRQ
ncbi:MAG: BsuPI-related putative proteinase inhibitor [Bryobacteraceae bacterium]